MTLSDRLAVMNEGKIEQVGPPEKIYEEPSTEFVADFIGDTNLFECTAQHVNGHAELTFRESGTVSFTTTRSVDEGDVTVSVRPERVQLLADGDGLFTGTVTERYFQGDHANYVVEPDDASLPVVEVTLYGESRGFGRGDRVGVDFDADAAPVFFD